MVNKLPRITTYVLLLIIAFVVGYSLYKQRASDETLHQAPNPEKVLASSSKELILRDSIAAFGMKYLGSPYVEAGNGEIGFDCSGFVHFVYKHFHIAVPRSSADFEKFGTEIPIDAVQKGDILLFLSPTRNVIGHIGIVLNADGKNSDFVHASSGREMKVIVSSVATKGYSNRFVKAIRVL